MNVFSSSLQAVYRCIERSFDDGSSLSMHCALCYKTFSYYQLNAVERRHLLFQYYMRQHGGSYVPAWQSLIACTFHMNALRCALVQNLGSYCQEINCVWVSQCWNTRGFAFAIVYMHTLLCCLYLNYLYYSEMQLRVASCNFTALTF